MKLKKSQITMLIIIGLVIFIAVSLVLYITKLAVNKQSQQNVKKVQVASFETQPIKEFVTQCLDKLAKEAVMLIGKQGGYIHKSQGGTIDSQLYNTPTGEGLFYLKHNDFNVAYNILPPSKGTRLGNSYADVPSYPWDTFPYEDSTSTNIMYTGYFGRNTMPSLYHSEKDPHSIQLQIETYIDNNMLNCANFDVFKQQGFEIVTGKLNTSVTIGSSDVSVNSKFPITITNLKTKEFTELSEFSTIISVRLKEVYLFTKGIIDNDVNDISFEIDKIENNKIRINIVRNVLVKGQSSNDDIVKVIDGNSLISGSQFEYVFARKNRAPALYCIKANNECKLSQTILQFPYGHPITEQDLLGTTLQNLQKNAKDPDEDALTFSITDFARNPQNLPKELNIGEINFRVQVSDGKLSDYQDITVKVTT